VGCGASRLWGQSATTPSPTRPPLVAADLQSGPGQRPFEAPSATTSSICRTAAERAGARLQGKGSRSAGDSHRPRGGFAGRRTARPRSARPPRNWASGRLASTRPSPSTLTFGGQARPAADRRGVGLVGEEGLEMEKSRGADDRVNQMSQVLPANAAAPDRRPRMDGVMGWRRIRAVASSAACYRDCSCPRVLENEAGALETAAGWTTTATPQPGHGRQPPANGPGARSRETLRRSAGRAGRSRTPPPTPRFRRTRAV